MIKINHGDLEDLHDVSAALSKTGFLIDIPNFYNMTAYQLLRYFAKLQHYPKDKINDRIDELLTFFKLTEWKYKSVKTFSKGMTQKIGIIQALIHDPDIIVLDEPQTGLDPLARIEIRKFLRELQSLGKTIFIASHMLYEISEICDKIALINHGEIIGFDTVENLAITLKANELNCVVLKPIEPKNLAPILERLTNRLQSYLDQDLDPRISKIPIKYSEENQGFKFYFDGKKESKVEILKVLIKEFETDFSVISYIQPRTSQLERVYIEMVSMDDQALETKSTRERGIL